MAETVPDMVGRSIISKIVTQGENIRSRNSGPPSPSGKPESVVALEGNPPVHALPE
jgi:hypothetical protein